MSKSNFLIVLLLLVVLGSTAIALSIAKERSSSRAGNSDRLSTIAPPTQDEGQRRFSDECLIRPAALSSNLRVLLTALGDRLETFSRDYV